MGKRSDVRRLHKEVSRELDRFKEELERTTGLSVTDADASLAWWKSARATEKEQEEIKRVFGFK